MRPFASLFLIGLLFVQVPFSSEKKEDKDNLDCSCIAHEDCYRIIGGKKVTGVGAFPWQVSIQQKRKWYMFWLPDDDIIDLHTCGGVIVNALFVMTAAHCFYDKDSSDRRVGFGFHDLLEINELKAYKEIQKVSWPKSYDHKSKSHDIALVELATPLKWSAFVKPACLPTSDVVREYERPLMVTGWGLTDSPEYDKKHYLLNDAKKSRFLKVAYVKDQTQNDVCKLNVKTQAICVFNQTSGKEGTFNDLSCNGDSGGPLHHTNKATNKVIVIGVSSFGTVEIFDKRLETYKTCIGLAVYTRVSAQMDWVKSIVGKRPEHDYCSAHVDKN